MKQVFLSLFLLVFIVVCHAQPKENEVLADNYLVLTFQMAENDDLNSTRSHTYIITGDKSQLWYHYKETGMLVKPERKRVMEISSLEFKMIERWIERMELKVPYTETYGSTNRGSVRTHLFCMSDTYNVVEGKNKKVVSDEYSISLEKFRRKLDGLVQSMGHTSR